MPKKIFSRIFAVVLVIVLTLSQINLPILAEEAETPFADVKGHYAEDVIRQWLENGFVSGLPDGSFAPARQVSRAEFVALLSRAFQLTETAGTAITFTDVAASDWFYPAVMASAGHNLITGYADGRFGSNEPISRQDAAVIVSRYLSLTDVYDNTYLKGFNDQDNISDYAAAHVAAMAELKLINGKPDGNFAPRDNISRADSVILLNNVYTLLAGTSGISGKLYADGKALADADITFLPKGDYQNGQTVSSDQNGLFHSQLAADSYDVLISKDNRIAFKSEVMVRTGYQTFLKLNTEIGQEVTALVKDSQGQALADTAFYFKVNPYFTAKSDKAGKLTIFLPKNQEFEIFSVEKGKLISYGKYSTKAVDGVLDLGKIKALSSNPAPASPSSPSADPSTPAEPEPDKPKELSADAKKMLGLDPDKTDNDGDGLNDYFEFSYLTTDLLVVDTDGNGISDADEDFDQDGLTNLREQELGTRPDLADSDGDGIDDGTEMAVHHTNPLSVDSDGDGLLDQEELKLGLNPAAASTDGITPDGERTFPQTAAANIKDEELQNSDSLLVPSIAGDVPGDIARNVLLEKSHDYVLNDNRSILSDAINVSTGYEQPLELSFAIQPGFTGDTKNLAIAALGENGITLVETSHDPENNQLSGQINGSGTYFVVDLNEFLKGLGIDVFANLQTPDTGSVERAVPLTVALNPVSLLAEDTDHDQYKYFYNQEGKLIDKKRILSSEDDAVENQNLDTRQQAETLSATPEAIDLEMMSLDLFMDDPVLPVRGKATGKADIAFVLDTTGSMDDDIMNVAANINNFVDRLMSEYNVDVNFSIITYNDIINVPNSTKIHQYLNSNWFTNVNLFKQEVIRIAQNDVGDGWDETPLDGLGMAKALDWRSNSAKFVILLTDEWSSEYNTYNYANLQEVTQAFADSKICVSVITEPSLQPFYQMLWEKTNGLYGNIFDNFSSVLIKLADKIGDITNADGEWVFLSDFQAVKLSAPLSQADTNDTDSDGLTDATELGSSEEKDMLPYIQALTNLHDIPVESYQGKTTLTVWNYLSNPVLLDTDYDGLPDGNVDYDGQATVPDTNPRNHSFAGKLHWDESGPQVSQQNLKFKVNYGLLFEDNTIYKKDLAMLTSLYATDIYQNSYIMVNEGINGGSDNTTDFPSLFGLKDVENLKINAADYQADPDDLSEIMIGHRQVSYKGATKEIVVISVRGTNGTHEEWTSNFDIGADTDKYYAATGQHPHWLNKQNHKGFDVAANRLIEKIEDYLSRYSLNNSPKTILLTGHSRGAAIANLIGANYEVKPDTTTYTYAFATPNNTTAGNVRDYKTIFNIINTDDMIPFMPVSPWGFDKYGVIKEISVEKHYENSLGGAEEGTWEWFVGRDYNNDSGTQRTLNAFAKITKNRDQLYPLDTSDEAKVWENDWGHVTKAGAEKELKELSSDLEKEKLLRFCKLYIVGGGWFTPYHVEINYSPAYATQVMANMIVGVGPRLGRDLAGKYADAKTSFVLSSGVLGVGGMTHPHLPITYYVIAYNDFQ